MGNRSKLRGEDWINVLMILIRLNRGYAVVVHLIQIQIAMEHLIVMIYVQAIQTKYNPAYVAVE